MNNGSSQKINSGKRPDTAPEEKKRRIHLEKVKARHTSHWDWDYLPHAELEKRLGSSRPATSQVPEQRSEKWRKSSLLAALIGMGLGLIAIASGIYYLTL
jgi:hypothetical protein